MPNQQQFTRAIFDNAQHVPEGLECTTNDTVERRFSVYRNNVIASLIEAMQDGFPKTQALVGEDFFRYMAHQFVNAHPPKSAVLHQYGDVLPQFIQTFEAANNVPYLADIAEIELKRRNVYFAADDVHLNHDELSEFMQSDLTNARIRLVRALQTHSSAYPIYDIWHRIDNADYPLSPDAQDVLIIRKNGNVELIALQANTSPFFSALTHGVTIEEAANKTLKANPQADISALVSLVISQISQYHISN